MMMQSKETRSETAHANPMLPSPSAGYTALSALALAILLTVLTGLDAAAIQSEPLSQRMIPIPHPITSLLRSPRVHRELKLTPVTIDQIEEAADEIDLPLWRLRDSPSDKRSEQAVKLIDQLDRRLSEILSVRQMERLDQIVWQAQGVEAILEPEVAARLKLSPEQIANISALLSSAYKRVAELRLNPQIRSESVRGTYIQKVRAETSQNIIALLNTFQQNTFAVLMGRSINLSQVRSIGCKAPEFEIETWINSYPVRLSELRGKVTVVHFYALGCGNCIRSLPYYNAWLKRFDADTFGIVGIHRPETERERNVENVKEKAAQAGMEYPIAIDNESLAWDAWGNHTWPTTYLIDKNGYVRYWWYGELNWQGNESEKYLRGRIQELITESAEG
jgi:thiol-disulfide isomerase/thioredoxin